MPPDKKVYTSQPTNLSWVFSGWRHTITAAAFVILFWAEILVSLPFSIEADKAAQIIGTIAQVLSTIFGILVAVYILRVQMLESDIQRLTDSIIDSRFKALELIMGVKNSAFKSVYALSSDLLSIMQKVPSKVEPSVDDDILLMKKIGDTIYVILSGPSSVSVDDRAYAQKILFSLSRWEMNAVAYTDKIVALSKLPILLSPLKSIALLVTLSLLLLLILYSETISFIVPNFNFAITASVIFGSGLELLSLYFVTRKALL